MDIIRGDGSDEEKHDLLKQMITEAIEAKPEMHCFEDRDNISEKHVMSSIGG